MLQADSTPFIGRTNELAEIARLLSDPACRLLTLAGPGGMGKTQLAQAAARQQILLHADGAFFVPLEAATTPEQMPAAIATALGLRLSAADGMAAEITRCLVGMDVLLVLDNFEHLLEGAEFVSHLLAAASGLKIIVTSREQLNLVEEWVFDLAGLEVPDDDACESPAAFSAVELFTTSARRVQPRFSLEDECASVVRICRLLEGMPLAIELAASWMRLMCADEIAAEIERGLDILETPARNMPAQHRQMRAVFDQSWSMLNAHEQAVFARLSVFAGGFRADAAEAVADATRRDLAQLLDKSWLRRAGDDGRFTIHELARQYGREHLVQVELGAARERHARFYATFLDRQWPELMSSRYKQAYRAIEDELDNIRAAWRWSVEHADADTLHQGLRALWFFFDSGSRFREGELLFAAAADSTREAGPQYEPLLGRLLARQGALYFSLDHFLTAQTLLEESLAVLAKYHLEEDSAFAELELGMTVAFAQHEAAPALHRFRRALDLYRALNNSWGIAYTLYWMSLVQSAEFAATGETTMLALAEAHLHEATQRFRALGHPWGIASVGVVLSAQADLRGDHLTAYEAAKAYTAGFEDIGVIWGVSQGLYSMSGSAFQLGRRDEARQLLLQALRIALKYGLWNHALSQVHSVAQWRLVEGNHEYAFELLGAVDAERVRLGRGHDGWALPLLEQLEAPQAIDLAAAIERGRSRAFEDVIRELIAELNTASNDSPMPAAPSANDVLDEPLTERELEILQLVAAGSSNREIAGELFLSVGTVKTHIHNLTGKLGASNRTEAAAVARRLGLVDSKSE